MDELKKKYGDTILIRKKGSRSMLKEPKYKRKNMQK